MPVLPVGQQWLVNRAQALGYRSNPDGVCHGVAHMGMHAWLLNDIDTFKNRLKRIYSIPVDQFANQADVDMRAFLDGIELYQQPYHYRQRVFDKHLSQKAEDAQVIDEYVQPIKLLAKGGVAIAKKPTEPQESSFSGIYAEYEMVTYFSSFQRALANRNPPFQERVSLILRCVGHSIHVGYDPKTKIWCLIDGENLEQVDKQYDDINILASEVMHSFFGKEIFSNIAFATDIYTTGHHLAELLPCIADWKESNEWKAIHELSALRIMPTDDNMNSWFSAASAGGCLDDVNKLLNIGVDVNQQNAVGITPLHRAASGNHLAIVKRLLSVPGIQVNQPTPDDVTALILAADLGNFDVVRELLKAQDIRVDLQTKQGETALMFAASNGHLDVVNILLENGANINLATASGITPLHYAIDQDNIEMVQVLLQAGADINIRATQPALSPLELAQQNNHTAIAELLRKQHELQTNVHGIKRIDDHESVYDEDEPPTKKRKGEDEKSIQSGQSMVYDVSDTQTYTDNEWFIHSDESYATFDYPSSSSASNQLSTSSQSFNWDDLGFFTYPSSPIQNIQSNDIFNENKSDAKKPKSPNPSSSQDKNHS